MKKIFKLFMVAVLGAAVSACTPDSPELPAQTVSSEDLVFGKAYTITQDADDPNTIYLKSLMSGVTPLWEHPQGRSQKSEVTVQIAFAGEYTFRYGVITPGGAVYAEPYTLTLATNNFAYVEDEMWTLLSGGRDNEKSWVLDIDADGLCRNFVGPVYFYGLADWYGSLNLGMDPYQDVLNSSGEVDTWNWCADWAGNSWVLADGAADYGTMTFDLKGGANVTVYNAVSNTTQQGTYQLNTETYTLKMTDAGILHEPSGDGNVADWGDARIMYLDENFLQIGVVRIEEPCLLVYNYISEEWRDNWSPSVEEPGEPELPEGWEDVVGKITQTSIKWTLSTENPIDWCNLDGSRMNGWNSPSDYPDWLGTPDPSVYENFSLTMDSKDCSYTAVAPDGTEVAGNYTLDGKGIYTFDNGLPTFSVISWASFATTAENQLRIMSIETGSTGVTGMWVGAKSTEKDEYTAYHLIANVGEGGGVAEAGYDAKIYFASSSWWPSGDGAITTVTGDGTYTCVFNVGAEAADAMVMVVDIVGLRNDYPASGATVKAVRYDGVEVAFDPNKVCYGDLEGNGNLRMELYSAYGPTVNDPAITISPAKFTELEIEFEVKFSASEAQVCLYNDNWWPSYSKQTNGGVLGVGKHKVTATLNEGEHITQPIVCCLDVIGFMNTVDDGESLTGSISEMKVNGEAVTIHPENLAYGDLEGNANFRFEFFNIYGSTGNGVETAPYDYSKSVIEAADFTDVGSVEMYVSILR